MNLFHVTLAQNAESIWQGGVDPHRSTGKLLVSWWVDRDDVVWALAHVSARYGVPVDQLIVIECDIPSVLVRRWATPGLYCVEVKQLVGKLWGYEQFIKPEV